VIVALALALLPAVAQGDSLTLEAFLARVRDAHPVARQAEAARQQARADLRAARGGFDPSVSATWDYKRFKGIGYYDEVDARLTVPTPWGGGREGRLGAGGRRDHQPRTEDAGDGTPLGGDQHPRSGPGC
jgi:outer membrane protein TolC